MSQHKATKQALIVSAGIAAPLLWAVLFLYPPGMKRGHLSVDLRPNPPYWGFYAGRSPGLHAELTHGRGCIVIPGRGRMIQLGPFEIMHLPGR